MIVVISHFSNETGWLDARLGTGAGQFGVMLFFMLSGFLMAYLYMGQACNRANIRRYAVARTGRVMPLFVLVVVLSYTFQKLDIHNIFYLIPNVKHLLSHLLMLMGTNVLWTIAPEIHFYILFVAMWRLTASREGYLYLLMAATLILLIFTDFPHPRGKIAGLPYDIHLFRALPYFFTGVAFGRLYSSFSIPRYLRSGWFILALLLVPLMYPDIFSRLTGTHHRMWADVGVLFTMSAVFFSVLFLVPDDNPLMSNGIGDFLGRVSYSWYLLHTPVFVLLKNWNFTNAGIHLMVFIACSLLVAFVSFKMIEQPSTRFIRGFATAKSGQPATRGR